MILPEFDSLLMAEIERNFNAENVDTEENTFRHHRLPLVYALVALKLLYLSFLLQVYHSTEEYTIQLFVLKI